MYVYIKTEPQLWTVGFYSPDEKWHADSDHSSPEKAAKRVHYLNGGETELQERVTKLEKQLEVIETEKTWEDLW